MIGSVRYEIEHVTSYRYRSPVRRCVMSLCLQPREDCGQRLLRFEATTAPAAPLTSERDCFGNTKHVLNIHREHEALAITTRSTVEVAPPAPLPRSLGTDAWEEIRSWREAFVHWDFTHASALVRPSSALTAFMEREGMKAEGDPLEALLRLSDTLYRSFRYVPGSTSVGSPMEHILESGSGVCQDYAHVMIAIARSWGVPARYVSGYLHVGGRSGAPGPQTAMHAWVECRLPDLDWIGFDPTNQSVADERYVRVAVGRDYHDVPPTRGVLQGGESSKLEVAVRIRPSLSPDR